MAVLHSNANRDVMHLIWKIYYYELVTGMEKDIHASHKGQGAATNREKGQGVTRTRAGAAPCKNGLARTLVKVKVFIQVKDCHNLHIYIGKSLTQVRSWSNYLYRLKVVIIFIHIQVKGCHNLHTYTVLPRSIAPPPFYRQPHLSPKFSSVPISPH